MTLHVALVGPDLFPAFQDFARALKAVGAQVTGVGATPRERLRVGLRRHLDHWETVPSVADGDALARALSRAGRRRTIDRLETVEERLIEATARARGLLGLPGLTPAAARLCRDKPAMKEALRSAGLPCAESAAADSLADLSAFAERVGYPVIVKPRAGLGSLGTYRVSDGAELERAARALGVGAGASVAVEEFVEGHEGFFDTLSIDGTPRFEFVSHYFPSVLEALSDRRISPLIVATNRVERESYSELRDVGRKVIKALGIGTSATHMEWFFGPKGLKVSEIGARPPGERLWDLYCVGNEIDLYREWALAVVYGRVEGTLSRKYATGSVQVRPPRDGKVAGYAGLERVWRRYGTRVFAHGLPRPGRRTVPIEKGYLGNAWLRLRDPDYDALREALEDIGRTLRMRVLPA